MIKKIYLINLTINMLKFQDIYLIDLFIESLKSCTCFFKYYPSYYSATMPIIYYSLKKIYFNIFLNS